MWIKSSLGKKQKPPESSNENHVAESDRATKQKPKKRPRLSQDPQKTDSTIATVTVFIGGGQDDAVNALHSTTASQGQELEDKRGSHRREVTDPSTGSPKMYLTKRLPRSKERKPQATSSEEAGTTLAVYDLDDRSKLPCEILDLLSCRRHGICVHDHDRCRVVNNKLYITAANDAGKKPPSPIKISGSRESPNHHRQAKRVTFSPATRQCGQSKNSRQLSNDRSLDFNQRDEVKNVPPPPHGYHVRIDPSSRDSSSERLDGDESTWTASDGEPGNRAETLQDAIKTAVSQAAHEKRLQGKDSNSLVGTCASPSRLAKTLHGQIKKLGFNSEYVVLNRKSKKQSRGLKETQESHREGAFGDSSSSDKDAVDGVQHVDSFEHCQEATCGFIGAAQRSGHKVEPDSEYTSGMSVGNTQSLKKVCMPATSHITNNNKARLRHTRRNSKNANNNSSKSLVNFTLGDCCHWEKVARPLTQVVYLMPDAFHLNTNTNACSDDEDIKEGVKLSNEPCIGSPSNNQMSISAPGFVQPEKERTQNITEIIPVLPVGSPSDQSETVKAVPACFLPLPVDPTPISLAELPPIPPVMSFSTLPPVPPAPPVPQPAVLVTKPPANPCTVSIAIPPPPPLAVPFTNPSPTPHAIPLMKPPPVPPSISFTKPPLTPPVALPIKQMSGLLDIPQIKPPFNSLSTMPDRQPLVANSPSNSQVATPSIQPSNPPLTLPAAYPAEPPMCEGGERPEKTAHSESEAEGWEAKKHNIMMACNEAIKNRLQRQELEESESRDVTTSDSAPSRHSTEARRRRKTKTTGSVYVKFKASLSKKTTTTTTLKEVKQSSTYGSSGKSLMIESDQQNALCLSSQSSDQSLSIPQPRLTRIIKCAELETPMWKRKLSSDTEVELQHLSESNKPQKMPSKTKTNKDGPKRDRQISQKENTFVEKPSWEDPTQVAEIKESCVTPQLSPQQKLTLGNGELICECDKLSEKASAITVINVTGSPPPTSDKSQSPSAADKEDATTRSKNKSVAAECSGLGSATTPTSGLKGKAKKRSKTHTSRHSSGKKKAESKISSEKVVPTVNESITREVDDQARSETSVSQEQKRLSIESSSVGLVRLPRRAHSSPPDCRKKKSGSKKKLSVQLVEPEEGGLPKRSSKSRKKSSPERRKKSRANALREERPRKTGSTTSSASEKKWKSQTTASSISIDSLEERACDKEETPIVIRERETETKSTEVILAIPTQVETCAETVPQKAGPSEANTSDTIKQACVSRVSSSPVFMADDKGVEANGDTVNRSIDCPPPPVKIVHKVLNKAPCLKPLTRNMAGEKDLLKAEMGWNNSVYQIDTTKKRALGERTRQPQRKNKLKYFIIKAKDKENVKDSKKDTKPKPEKGESIKDQKEAFGDQSVAASVGDMTQKVQGKTVQFSDSIENVETMKQTEMLEKAGSVEERAQDGQVAGDANDDSVEGAFLSESVNLSNDFLEDDATLKQPQAEMEIGAATPDTNSSPKKHKRPVWLKKAASKPVTVEEAAPKPNLSPVKVEKNSTDSFEEVLKPKKCNIQVTYPLQATGVKEHPALKTRVAYSSMLSSIFMAMPLKKAAKRLVAQIGSPVDIKEVTEGSSVDAADYAKALRYSPRLKHVGGAVSASAVTAAGAVPSAGGKRKKGSPDSRATAAERLTKPGKSCSGRSLASAESDLERRVLTPDCSFSTNLDEVSVCKQRSTHSAPGGRGQRVAVRKKEKRPGTAADAVKTAGRVAGAVPWHLVSESAMPENGRDQASDGLSELPSLRLHVAGDYVETGRLNIWMSRFMRQFFNRFNFLNTRRPNSSAYLPSSERDMDTAVLEHSLRVL